MAAEAREFSFEFFPPRTPEGREKLRVTWQALAKLKPRFFSCTYGAGGSTREDTLETVLEIIAAGHQAAPHISCVASTRKDVLEQLERYKLNGIRHLVALRGDLPSGIAASGEFRYASELVAFIRQSTGDWFHIEVACYPEYHPQTRNAADEVKNFKKKADAGANGAITQYSTTPMPTCASWTTPTRRASPCPSSPASCRSGTSRSWRAFRTPAAPRSRAGCASSSKATATTAPRSAPSGWTS
jgi:methylenetetrahydrofolate reductase (NADPH)